ncbi:MAG: type II toxin-antitoxin system PemK/MazF family toxin [Coriobacteriales bacterium]|jgi:mRNA interferase MazF|nr:type II toxin-antitoxin system PemK/MazF family toxin [Coriobacteriales bacterium]
MIYRQGDIIEVDFSPSKGHEAQKRRPCIVVSNEAYNISNSTTLVCPITSTSNNHYLHFPVEQGYAIDGFIVIEQIKSFDLDARPTKLVDHYRPEHLTPILTLLRSFF